MGRHGGRATPTRVTRKRARVVTRSRVRVTSLLAVAFFNGAGQATLGTRVVGIQEQLHLDYAQLGHLVAGFPLGLLIGALLAMVLSDRIGSRPTLAIGGLLYWGALIAVGVGLLLGWTPIWLTVIWGLGGVGNSFLDVGQGVHSTAGLNVLVFQAAEKLGGSAAGVFGTIAIAMHVGVALDFLLAGGVTLGLGGAAAMLLPRIAHRASSEETPPAWAHPRRGKVSDELGMWRLLAFGIIAAGTALPLLTALDWGGPILKAAGAPKVLTSNVVIFFPAAAALGLWVAQTQKEKVRPERAGRIGAAIALAGVGLLALDLVVSGPVMIPIALVAFGLLGFGLAPVAGTAQKAATIGRCGRFRVHARMGVVVLVQCVSGSAAPVLVGALANRVGVIAAMAYVNGACAVVVVFMAGLLWYAQPVVYTDARAIAVRRRRTALLAFPRAGRHRSRGQQMFRPALRHRSRALRVARPVGRHERAASTSRGTKV
jgi:MFS family permease